MRKRSSRGWLPAVCCTAALFLIGVGVFNAVTFLDAQSAAAQEPAAGDLGADAQAPTVKKESVLSYYYRALKLKYTVAFLFLSFVLVALVVMHLMSIRRDNFVPLALIEAFEANLNEKKYQEAYELAKGDESFLGKVLAAGLAKLSAGYEKAIESMQEVGEEENLSVEHKLSYLALIGSVAPMVGLLGTVDGMIGAFQTIEGSPTSPRPSELAGDISMALVTTLFGLYLAIPAVAIYLIFKNRASRFVLEVGIVSEGLMSRFEALGKGKTATA